MCIVIWSDIIVKRPKLNDFNSMNVDKEATGCQTYTYLAPEMLNGYEYNMTLPTVANRISEEIWWCEEVGTIASEICSFELGCLGIIYGIPWWTMAKILITRSLKFYWIGMEGRKRQLIFATIVVINQYKRVGMWNILGCEYFVSRDTLMNVTSKNVRWYSCDMNILFGFNIRYKCLITKIIFSLH